MYFEDNVTRCTARKLFFCSCTQDNTLPFVSKRVFRFGHKITSNFPKCQTIPRGEGFALTISELHNQASFIFFAWQHRFCLRSGKRWRRPEFWTSKNASRPGPVPPTPCHAWASVNSQGQRLIALLNSARPRSALLHLRDLATVEAICHVRNVTGNYPASL